MNVYIFDNAFAAGQPLRPTTVGLEKLNQSLIALGSTHSVSYVDAMPGPGCAPFVLIVHPADARAQNAFTREKLAGNGDLENHFVVLVSSDAGRGMHRDKPHIRWYEYPVSNLTADMVDKFATSAAASQPNWSLLQALDVNALVAYYLLHKAGKACLAAAQPTLISEVKKALNTTTEPVIAAVAAKLNAIYA